MEIDCVKDGDYEGENRREFLIALFLFRITKK